MITPMRSLRACLSVKLQSCRSASSARRCCSKGSRKASTGARQLCNQNQTSDGAAILDNSFLEWQLMNNGVVMLRGRRVVGPEDVERLMLNEGLSRADAVRKVMEEHDHEHD